MMDRARLTAAASRRAVALACLAALAGCVIEQPVAYRPVAPAPRGAAGPVAPPGAYVWRPGHWRWNGFRYVWVRGHYVVRPV